MKPQPHEIGAPPPQGIAPSGPQLGGLRAVHPRLDSSLELQSGLDFVELSTDVRLFDLMYELETAIAAVENDRGNT
jgi:hypothetical protein